MARVTSSKMHPDSDNTVMVLMDQETANYLYSLMEFGIHGDEEPMSETLMRTALKSALAPVTQAYRR